MTLCSFQNPRLFFSGQALPNMHSVLLGETLRVSLGTSKEAVGKLNKAPPRDVFMSHRLTEVMAVKVTTPKRAQALG